MAAHLRTQIRDAVVAILSGLPTTGANVFVARGVPLSDNKLPAIIVETNGESVDDNTIYGQLQRELTLTLKVRVKETGAVDQTIDAILKEIEAALYASSSANTLGGLVNSVRLRGIANGVNGGYELPVGHADTDWLVLYFTQAGVPDASA